MKIGTTIISSVEFHGNMSLVIFMATCPLRCPYCHNGEILEDGDDIDIGEVYKVIDGSKDFIDAVDVSGGEPLLQLNDLISILRVAKKLGLKEVPTICVSLNFTNHLYDLPMMKTFINAYSPTRECISSTIEKILGKSLFEGVPNENVWCGRWDTRI